MLKIVKKFFIALFTAILFTGCQSTTDRLADSASGKNVNPQIVRLSKETGIPLENLYFKSIKLLED